MTALRALVAAHAKLATAVTAVVVGVILQVAGADSEWYKLAVGLAGSLGVYAVPNRA